MVSIVWFVKMFTSSKKISKDKGAEPTEFEESVAQVSYNASCCAFQAYYGCGVSYSHELISVQAIFDLENTNQELKSELKDLYINSAV